MPAIMLVNGAAYGLWSSRHVLVSAMPGRGATRVAPTHKRIQWCDRRFANSLAGFTPQSTIKDVLGTAAAP